MVFECQSFVLALSGSLVVLVQVFELVYDYLREFLSEHVDLSGRLVLADPVRSTCPRDRRGLRTASVDPVLSERCRRNCPCIGRSVANQHNPHASGMYVGFVPPSLSQPEMLIVIRGRVVARPNDVVRCVGLVRTATLSVSPSAPGNHSCSLHCFGPSACIAIRVLSDEAAHRVHGVQLTPTRHCRFRDRLGLIERDLCRLSRVRSNICDGVSKAID